jgi:hypothetical protein
MSPSLYLAGSYVDPTATWTPTYNLSTDQMNNGEHASLTVTVPPGTPSQSYAIIGIGEQLPSQTSGVYGLVGVYVQ